jgi:hypothetical protein
LGNVFERKIVGGSSEVVFDDDFMQLLSALMNLRKQISISLPRYSKLPLKMLNFQHHVSRFSEFSKTSSLCVNMNHEFQYQQAANRKASSLSDNINFKALQNCKTFHQSASHFAQNFSSVSRLRP